MALVIVVSFLGFCLENIWMLFSSGVIDNRNMNLSWVLHFPAKGSGLDLEIIPKV